MPKKKEEKPTKKLEAYVGVLSESMRKLNVNVELKVRHNSFSQVGKSQEIISFEEF